MTEVRLPRAQVTLRDRAREALAVLLARDVRDDLLRMLFVCSDDTIASEQLASRLVAVRAILYTLYTLFTERYLSV